MLDFKPAEITIKQNYSALTEQNIQDKSVCIVLCDKDIKSFDCASLPYSDLLQSRLKTLKLEDTQHTFTSYMPNDYATPIIFFGQCRNSEAGFETLEKIRQALQPLFASRPSACHIVIAKELDEKSAMTNLDGI